MYLSRRTLIAASSLGLIGAAFGDLSLHGGPNSNAMAANGGAAMAVPLPLAPLPVPLGEVILTIDGLISVTNAPDEARFDYDMLEEVGVQTVVTSTPWTDEPQSFDVVPLDALLERVGASGDLIFAEAINDYNAEIPISDALGEGAMIALRRNGAPMPLRDKGPLWIIYPYDGSPKYNSEVYYTRSIWQLYRLSIRDSARQY